MLLVFAAALAVQLGYWLLLKMGLGRVKAAQENAGPGGLSPAPLSVVVAARNEAERLPALLDALAAQTHPHWEVVIVDDASEDATAALVEARAAEDPRFRLVRAAEPHGKKNALALGIAAAHHARLAFTDADCVPPPGWLAVLARHAGRAPEAVLVGYGPLRGRPGALGAFVRYETLVTALLAAAAVGLGRPFLAVGRNLSYPRALFERIGGFEHSRRSLSGDDDLLVQEVARTGAAPVRYVLDPAAFVPSEAPPTWRAWARQKLRHTSAGRFYRRGAQAHLALFHASNLAVWLAPVFLGWTGAGLLAARFLGQRLVLGEAARAFGEEGLMPAQPLLDLGYLLYNSLLAPLGTLRVPRRW